MNVTLRSPIPADADACGRIMYEAFGGIADQHAFPRDFPSVEVATQLATCFHRRAISLRSGSREGWEGGRQQLPF